MTNSPDQLFGRTLGLQIPRQSNDLGTVEHVPQPVRREDNTTTAFWYKHLQIRDRDRGAQPQQQGRTFDQNAGESETTFNLQEEIKVLDAPA